MRSLRGRLALVLVVAVAGMLVLDGYLRRRARLARMAQAGTTERPSEPAPATVRVRDSGQVPSLRWWLNVSGILTIERAGAARPAALGQTLLRAVGDGSIDREFSPLPPEGLVIDGPELHAWTPEQRGVLLDTIESLLAEAGLSVAEIRIGPELADGGLVELLTRVRAPSRLWKRSTPARDSREPGS